MLPGVYDRLVAARRQLDIWIKQLHLLLRDLFVNQLPAESLQNLPSPYIYWSGIFIYSAILAVFLAVFVSVFQSTRSERYLSLTSEGMICEEVYKEFSGTYLVDSNGNWEGLVDFKYTHAIYKLDINNFMGSQSDFSELMDAALAAINEIGAVAYEYNLGLNLVLWMMYQGTANYQGSKQVISLAGSPKTIFNRQNLAGGMNNIDGGCDVNPRINYYRSDATIVYEYQYEEFVQSPACMNIMDPLKAGFDPDLNQGVFKLSIHVESIITAIGVNLGLIAHDELEQIPGSEFTYSYKGEDFLLSSYYYSQFPGMRSLTCYGAQENDGKRLTCAIEIGDLGLVGYPLFDHSGFNATDPRPCICGADYSRDARFACNDFNLMGGLLFFSNEEGGSMDSFFEFVFFSDSTPTELVSSAFNATFDTTHSRNAYKNNEQWRADAFEFCEKASVSNAKCGVLGFATADTNHPVTDYYYQVPWGSCNDSFTVSAEIQDKMKSSPPTTFTEIYLECRNGIFDVVNSSIGLAMGNLAMYIPVVVFIASCLMGLYMRWRDIEIAKTYSSKEKDDILQYLAFNMLLARDDRYRFRPKDSQKTGFDHSLVIALKDELSVNVGIRRFYEPDSKNSTRPEKSSCGVDAVVEMTEIGAAADDLPTVDESVIVHESDERLMSTDFIENPLFRPRQG